MGPVLQNIVVTFGGLVYVFGVVATVVTAVIEGFSPKDIDNILIPFSSMIVYYLFL